MGGRGEGRERWGKEIGGWMLSILVIMVGLRRLAEVDGVVWRRCSMV